MQLKFLMACVAGAGGIALAQAQDPMTRPKAETADKWRPAAHEGIKGAATVDNWKVKPNELKIDTVKGRPAADATNTGTVQGDPRKDYRAVAPAKPLTPQGPLAAPSALQKPATKEPVFK